MAVFPKAFHFHSYTMWAHRSSTSKDAYALMQQISKADCVHSRLNCCEKSPNLSTWAAQNAEPGRKLTPGRGGFFALCYGRTLGFSIRNVRPFCVLLQHTRALSGGALSGGALWGKELMCLKGSCIPVTQGENSKPTNEGVWGHNPCFPHFVLASQARMQQLNHLQAEQWGIEGACRLVSLMLNCSLFFWFYWLVSLFLLLLLP